jgi:Copper binding proteins, plastocyanin/azurin family
MPRRLALALLAAAAALVFALPGGARPAKNVLAGTVGPGFTIVLRDEGGNVVKHLDPGTYEITIDDRSAEHNFHLSGPGVSMSTDVEFVGTVVWTVAFTNGTYRYQCDPHATLMKGSFTAGTVSSPAPPAAKRLAASVGPGMRIALRSASGVRVKTLKRGSYAIAVADRSRSDNFHLRGPGVNARTGVAFTGRRTWKVKLAKGLYTYRSDRHPALRGSFRVR